MLLRYYAPEGDKIQKMQELQTSDIVELNELVDRLSKAISSLTTMIQIDERAKKIGTDHQTALIHKRIEEGILRDLDKASQEQLERIVDGGFEFRYYYEIEDILRKTRRGTLEFTQVK